MAKKKRQQTDDVALSRIEEAQRKRAVELDLKHLGLTALPESIGQLAQLQVLNLSGNQLTALPESIGQFAQLQWLVLSENQLTALPESIGQLAQLQILVLSENQLTVLPESIGQLAQLQALQSGNNQLTALPESIGQLAQLQRLTFNYNQLTALPESIGQLAQLQNLSLDNNQLTALPESIGQLAQLQTLWLGNNRLTALPESIGQLAQLHLLDLNNNHLAALPESIGQLVQLQNLYLSNNQLTALPESIDQLTKLVELYLHGNDSFSIPPEILGPTWSDIHLFKTDQAKPAKPADILQYYFRSRQEPKRRLNEAKILIVGQGGAGKTSLVKRLVKDEYDAQEKKTEGINIAPWQIPGSKHQGPDAEPIRLNIWDFGGQEIMHATHQFFLTKRSLYLVVLDAREGEVASNIHYWLKIIQSYGGDSPVLVVTNKIETHQLDLDETRLRLNYAPNLKDFFKVSCATGAGIPQLRAAIEEQINALPHVFDALPVSYFQVKEQLAKVARTKNFIDYSEYERLCKKNGVTQPRDKEILIRFLHDLGNVLNFHDPDSPYELRDTNILNPEWVTGGVYKLLNNNVLMQQQGNLEMAQLGAILDDRKRYPEDRHKFIIEMMRKFELCFDFPDTNGQRLLIPELLPKNEPDLDWKAEEALNFQYHYNVLPGGIICRFIVRMHHNLTSKPTYWRSGVVLDIDGNRALVRADTEEKRIYIAVLGPAAGRRRALSVIRNTLKAIHHTIPKLVAQEKVPLPDNPAVVVSYEHLLNLEELRKGGDDTFLPDGANKEYRVQDLLNGIEDKSDRRARLRKDHDMVDPKPPAPPPVRNNPWISGLFYLFAFVVVVMTLAWASNLVPWYGLIAVLLAALLAITIIGALQLRNDDRLKEAPFLTLVKEFYRRLLLLKLASGAEATPESAEPTPPNGKRSSKGAEK